MKTLSACFFLLLLSLTSIVAQAPTLPWNDVIYLGQSSSTSKVVGLSPNGLNQPPSLTVIANSLVVSDYNNARVLTYNLNQISTSRNAYAAVNSVDLNTKGSYGASGVEGYSENGNSYIWVGVVGNTAKKTPDSLVRYTLPLTTNQPSDGISYGGTTFSGPQTVVVDVKNQLSYVVDSGNNRILQYSNSNLARPIQIFGQTNLTNTKANQGGKASAQTLYSPTKVLLGCNNDLYIVDARNHRVLHFLNSNARADAVLGQPDFTTTTAGSTASKLNTPYSAALNSDCSFLWVADTLNNRIVKFNVKNLVSGSAAVGQVGDSANQGPAVDRFHPQDIALDERTGRVWIADAVNNRVLGAISSDVASATPSLSLSGTASISISVSVSTSVTHSVSGSLSLSPSTSLSGSLSLSPSTSLSGSVSLSPSTSLSGSLSLSPSTSLSGSLSLSPSTSISSAASVTNSKSLSPSPSPHVLPPPSAVYLFDDPSALGRDFSCQGFNAVNYGATYSSTGYKAGSGSAYFDGVSSYLRSSLTADPFVLPQMTWGAWVLPTVLNGIGAAQILCSDNGGYDRNIDIDPRDSFYDGPTWSLFVGEYGAIGSSHIIPSTSSWTFIAAVYDQNVGEVLFFVNSQAFGFETSFGPAESFFNIGASPNFSEFFQGYIDDVFFYNTSLTNEQVLNIYNNGVPHRC